MSMQSILSASLSLNRIQVMQSVQTQKQGQINVLQAEIKQDNGNARKEEQVEALEEQKSSLMGGIMDELTDVNETLKPSEGKDEESTVEKPDAGKEPNTDKADLSHRPENGGESGAVRGEEPVSYDAQGKTEKAQSAPSGKKVDAKA